MAIMAEAIAVVSAEAIMAIVMDFVGFRIARPVTDGATAIMQPHVFARRHSGKYVCNDGIDCNVRLLFCR